MRATAIITWPALLAPVIAPVLGGFITTYFSWRWNFLLNVPLGIAGVFFVARYVPRARDDQSQTLDWSGFTLSAAALVAMLYGLESVTRADGSFGWLIPVVSFACGLVVAIVAVRHLTRTRAPLVDLSAAGIQTFRLSTLTAGAAYRVAINATPFLLPLMFQVGFGLSALASGMLVLAYFLGNIAMKPFTSPVLRRFGFRNASTINGAIGGLAIMACATLSATTSRPWILVVLLLAGLTRSMQFTSMNTLAYADVSPPQRGSAATLSSMLQQIVAVLGVASGALLLRLSALANHHASVLVLDFHIAFIVIGLIALIAAIAFLKLPSHAGAEVSGHSAEVATSSAS
jgi:MFS family permease